MAKCVYALVGRENFLQLEALARLLAQFPAQVQRVDADGQSVELAEVFDELRSMAMFGPAKVVVVRNGDDFVARYRKQLEKYLENPGSGILVLRLETLPKNQTIYKLIAKTGQIEACDERKPSELPGWLIERAKSAHQTTLAPEAARLLVELVGSDMGRLDNELAKLALQSDKGRINAANVNQGVVFQREQEMWDMTNELAAGRLEKALARWRQLVQMDSSAEFRAVTWLGMWLEKVAQALPMIRDGSNAFTIGQALKIWPRDLQQPFVETAKKLGEAGVEKALDALVQVDFQSKTGVGEAATNVERFLLMVGSSISGGA